MLARLFMIICFLCSINVCGAQVNKDCLSSEKHDSVTYLLVDRSDELKDTQNLRQSLAVAKGMITAGERLIVGVSTGKASETRVLMDYVKPKKSLWVSKLKIRAAQKKFDDCFNKVAKQIEVQNESHKSSALLETLGVVSKALKSDSSKTKRVIMFSDMVQNSSAISFYKSPVVNTAKTIKKVESEFLMSSFKGVEFHVAGVGTGTSDKKARSIEQFWAKFIETAGGDLRFYGPVLFASS